jgi:predicted SprT family Zn-dependent metalloprotease
MNNEVPSEVVGPRAENPRKLLTRDRVEKVEKRVRELLDKASEIWPDKKAKFEDAPTIRYDIKNRFGGVAISGGKEDWTIRLNLILMYENEEDFLHNTVGHETAHLICRVVYGSTKKVTEGGKTVVKKVRSHGPEWRQVMIELGLKPAVYHTYDTSSIQVKKRKRKPRGAKLTISETIDMLKRLKGGIRRLDDDAKRELMEWIDGRLNGDEEDDE